MIIFAGRASRKLSKTISHKLNSRIANVNIKKFSDGEICLKIKQNIAGQVVIIIQSTSKPVNDHLIELLLLIRAARSAEAKKIIVLMPYFGYGRSDKKFSDSSVIAAELVAELIEKAGADQIIFVDLHSEKILDFFSIPASNINLIDQYLAQIKCKENLIIVSPDYGGKARAFMLANKLDVGLVVIAKKRLVNNSCFIRHVDNIDKINGKNCLIIDDIIDTGQTICKAAEFLLQHGAISVSCMASHGVLSKEAIKSLENSAIENIYLSNSISLEKLNHKFKIIDLAEKLTQELVKIMEWWSQGESNPRPFECHSNALPTEP